MNNNRFTHMPQVDADLDELRALRAAIRLSQAEARARMHREAVKGSVWAFVGFAFCLALLALA